MTLSKRQSDILSLLTQSEWLSLSEAVRRLGASPASVRRDFEALDQAGALLRVRGGVRRKGAMVPFEVRERLASKEKDQIAGAAVALLEPGDVLMVDGGTTTLHMGAQLPAIPLTLVTNSVRLAAFLDARSSQHPDLTLVLTGGQIHPGSGMLVGPLACEGLRRYHADWAFLSAEGIDPDGLYNTNDLVVETERTMIECADRTAVLIDHTKVGSKALSRIASLDRIDTVLCDAPPAWLTAQLSTKVV